MATLLNKSRVRYTRLTLILAGFLILFTKPMIPDESPLSEVMDMVGELLVILCAIGRLYCTTFIGGRKNEMLVVSGPFSVCRNPLYFSSFLGACGIGLMSGHLVLLVALPLIYCAVYFPMITREEKYLIGQFSAEYEAYMASTPRFIPNFSRYIGTESVPVQMHFLHKALKDSVLWFLTLPLFEGVEYLQDSGLVHTLFVLP